MILYTPPDDISDEWTVIEIQSISEEKRDINISINNKLTLTWNVEYTWISLPSQDYEIIYNSHPDTRWRFFTYTRTEAPTNLLFGDAIFDGPYGVNSTSITITSKCEAKFSLYNYDLDLLYNVTTNDSSITIQLHQRTWILANGSLCFWNIRS